MLFLCLALLSLILFLLAYLVRRANIHHLSHLPGPPTSNYWLGNSAELKDPVTRVETIGRWYREYGPVFKLTGGVFTNSEVILVDPDVENTVMRMADKGSGFWPFKWFMKYICRTQAVFVLDGHEWERRRKELMHNGFMYTDLPQNYKVLNANLQKVMHLVESKQAPTDIHQLASVVLIDSMAETLFNVPLGVIERPDHPVVSYFESIVKNMAIVQNYPLHFFKYSTLMAMTKVSGIMSSSEQKVDERLKNPAKFEACPDVCSKTVQSGVLPRKAIIAEMTGSLLAASGNPSLTITWLLFTLVKHPEIKAKLEAEIESVLGDRSTPTFEELKSMKYLDLVLQETLRMFIPDAIHRRANTDITLHGHVIPAGSQIWIPSFLSHFEKVGPNPYEFNPDRFLSETPIRIHPFGGGPRICLGHMWTKLAAKLVVANLIHNFHISLDTNNPPVVPEFHMLLFESAKIKFNFEKKARKDESVETPRPFGVTLSA